MAVNTKVEYLPFRERASQRLSTALSEASYQASSSASRARCSEVSPTLECEIVSPVVVRLERAGSNALQSTRKGRETVTPALDLDRVLIGQVRTTGAQDAPQDFLFFFFILGICTIGPLHRALAHPDALSVTYRGVEGVHQHHQRV